MRQIRNGVFETNSSSVHSLTMCSNEEYEQWKNGKTLYWEDKDKFGTREDIIEELQNMRCIWRNNELYYSDTNWDDEDDVNDVFSNEGIKTYEKFFDNWEFETFVQSHTTPSGDNVVAFGYYGHN